MVHFFHEGGDPYLKGEKPPTPSSISNTGLIDGVPPLSANVPLRFLRIIYMGQAHKSNKCVVHHLYKNKAKENTISIHSLTAAHMEEQKL